MIYRVLYCNDNWQIEHKSFKSIDYAMNWFENSELSKAWLFCNSEYLYVLKPNKNYTRIADLKYHEYKPIDNIYTQFCIAAWGGLYYLTYGGNKSNHENPVETFMEKFPANELQYYIEEMISTEDVEDIRDWVSEGMRFRNDKINYFCDEVLDLWLELAQENVKNKPLLIFKSWRFSEGTKAGYGDYDCWISTSKNNSYVITEKYFAEGEAFLLPVGFPIIETHGLADTDEVIIKSQWLKNL